MNGRVVMFGLNEHGEFYGYIADEAGTRYHFTKNSIASLNSMQDFRQGRSVEFEPQITSNKHIAINVKLKNSERIDDASVSSQNQQTERSHENSSNQVSSSIKLLSSKLNNFENSGDNGNRELFNYFKPGFAKILNKSKAFSDHLKDNSGEDRIIEMFSKLFHISRISHHSFRSSSFPFCLVGSTEYFKQFIRGRYEFLLIFSYFESKDWQAMTLQAHTEIRKRREVSDRRPLVNFYILISNAHNIIHEIDKTKGGTNAAVIPFSFDELLSCSSVDSLKELVLSRFGNYLYENNMFAEQRDIIDDALLFGDRGKIADSIVDRCRQRANSGIFGLRRSGKTSVLNAVLRRLERDQIKYVSLVARDYESVATWRLVLFNISKEIRKITLQLEQYENERREQFESRLSLSSVYSDYELNAVQCFVEDVKLYTRNEKLFVIAIDEIELITYNTAKTSGWKNIESYCAFWTALRDCGCVLIICGVNSTINESNIIAYNGSEGDNPMYGRIINCTESSTTYLPVFTDMQTRNMINTLGGYSNIAFSDVYVDINRAFGGHPYAIRQFCSFAFEKVKHLRKHSIPLEISRPTCDQLLKEYENSADGNMLCQTVLQHLRIFEEEYEMLKTLAISPNKVKKVDDTALQYIDHLEKYGLVEYDRETKFVTFKIKIIESYIRKSVKKDPLDMDNTERRRFVQDSVSDCERKLKKYILNYYIYHNATVEGCRIMRAYISKQLIVCKKKDSAFDLANCVLKDYFIHSDFIFYFSTIKKIIVDNWSTLGARFVSSGIKKERFIVIMDDLNAGRTDADHYDAEDLAGPNKWEISDVVMKAFCQSLSEIEKFLSEACL